MFAFLVDLFSGIVQFLTGVLPRSPFADLTLPEVVHQYLGWLNWIVPINSILTFLGLVLTAFAVAKVAMWVISKGMDATKIATGGQ